MKLRVQGDDGKALAVGEIGNIQVKGPNVFQAYWRMPEKTKEEFTADGFFKTGDVGKIDERGYVVIVGRSKDLIISGGYNVYPAEIERVLAGMPGIIEVAVIGVPHEKWGEAPAVVVFTGGAEVKAEDVLARCKAQLADFKLPRYFHVSPTPLPRNMSGKILKRELKIELAHLPQTSKAIR